MLNKIKQWLFPEKNKFKYSTLEIEEPRKVTVVKKAAAKKTVAKKKPAVKKPVAKKTVKKSTPKKK